ncbi:MAG: PIN domain-containing protein [Bacillota bacterium]|nr:PIN domain-containing protein [Bacillota bacterium]
MKQVMRTFIALLGAFLGYYLGLQWLVLLPRFSLNLVGTQAILLVAGFTLLGFLVFFGLGPFLINGTIRMTSWMENGLAKIPAKDMAWGILGIIFGLIIAGLSAPALGKIPQVGNYLPAAVSLLLGYLGWAVAVRKRDDWASFFNFRGRDAHGERGQGAGPKVLDTSVIIDGRIVDLCRTGFLEGTLIVPSFVLDELRHIADSSDASRRNRGRRGLEVLDILQNELRFPLVVENRPVRASSEEVDAKLVALAKDLGAKLLTNDYNLSKVAQLQGVQVLNLHELANALKPVFLPGEQLQLQILREGKEPGQGVGFLDDGTMVVVEGGNRFLQTTVTVEVTSVLQTTAGRMIFARPLTSAVTSH